MRPYVLLLAVLPLLGCPSSDQSVADSAASESATETTTIGNMAGGWTVRAMPEQGDTTLLTYTVNATSDTTGWTVTFPGREPMPVRVLAVDADSVVLEIGPYESVLRPNVQVVTQSVSRIVGDRLVGTAVARYRGTGVGADSVVRLRLEGTRAP